MTEITYVCNASPLIFLAKINMLSLLDLYDLRIPRPVLDEIHKGSVKHTVDASMILSYLIRRNITPVDVNMLKELPEYLGEGEKSVISCAVSENIGHVFIDEAKARTVARFYGLIPRGVLDILWKAYKSGELHKDELESLSFRLIEHGYRIKEQLLIEFLKNIRSDGL